MDPKVLGPILMDRFAKIAHNPQNYRVVEAIRTFVNVKPSTIQRWVREPAKYPRGETLNRLWYCLRLAGAPSPEIDDLPEYGGYLGQLLAFRLVTLDEIQDYCNVHTQEGAFRVIRGDQEPSKPKKEFDINGLRLLYKDDLNAAITRLNVQLQPPDEPSNGSPEPVHVIKVGAGEQSVIEATRLQAPTAFERLALILQIAREIATLHASMQFLVNFELTPEERGLLRKLVDKNVLFSLENLLNRFSSERAFKEGE